jgi:diguanylate cyclase (GGDEF)-like protein/PAS domain S-box-containing protein
MGPAAFPSETSGLNLSQNSGSASQREILDALPALVFLEREGKIVFANREARQLLGLTAGEWVPCPVEDVLWGLYPGTAEPQTLLTGSGRGSPFHATLPSASGRLLPVEGTYSTLSSVPREAVIVAHPGGREPAPRLRLMDDVLSSIPEAVVILHSNNVLYTNPAFTRMFGYTAEEASEGSLWDLIVPQSRREEYAMVEKAVDQYGRARIETTRLNKNGDLVEVAMLAGPLLVDGVKVGYVLSYRDIGERKQKEAQLEHDALHDVLTGLPNRALFLDRLTQALTRRLRRRDQSCGVLFIDLDRFKEINDSMGHVAGDALLVAVSARLRSALRPQDSAARLGGDEFGVLVENIVTAADLDIVAGRVSMEMERPFEVLGHTIQAGASIGVAMAGPDHLTPEMLIRDADYAMYSAKQEGGGRYEIFDKHLEVHFASQQERERELRHVLDKRQFEFWYQPIYRLQNGRLEGFESLLRWRRADGSVDSFRDLLPVADDTGLAISLGRETLDAVCSQLRSWTEAVPQADLTLTVNVTYRQFYHPDLVGMLQTILAVSGVDPSRLLFEVSETTLNENQEAAAAILQRMVDCKVRIGVDNFGSSLAPLNHLLRLPIDMLKLDPRLTVAATSTGRQLVVLKSLVRLGQSLGVQVVAQGIETPAQLHALCRMGCELGQGQLLSHAMNAARALELAREGRWVTAPDA